ncbi:hypothetical protein [Chroococcidiopsis sp. SAG 2025]|nr:hypothetical protein [Chroococcidiopsis sp. SAG 2025]
MKGFHQKHHIVWTILQVVFQLINCWQSNSEQIQAIGGCDR